VSDSRSDHGAEDDAEPSSDRRADALRTAVERTLAATAGSAAETRERARGLLDEVVRRGEGAREEIGRRGDIARQELERRGEAAREGVSRRGQAAREQVVRGSEAAREDLIRRGEEASGRLAELLSELKLADREQLGPLADRLAAIETRLGDLERVLRSERLGRADSKGESNPQVEDEISPEEADSGA
jgi:polyhydroxyalkanoate synthesis regulator phasin